MPTKELATAPTAAAPGRGIDLVPAAWSGPDREPLLIRAAATSIGNALNALLAQTRVPDQIVVKKAVFLAIPDIALTLAACGSSTPAPTASGESERSTSWAGH